MNYKRLLLLMLVLFTFLTNAQNSIQVSSAEVSFVFEHNDVEGTLSGFSSSSTIDLNDLENANLKGVVQVKTISTGNSFRNWSLRRSKYFDADTYPEILFESKTIQIDEGNIQVIGQLTIKDVTKEFSFNFIKKDKQLVGTAVLYSSDYGIHIHDDREENKVRVKIVMHLTE